MMGGNGKATGLDFSEVVALGEVPEGGMLAVRVGDESVLLSRLEQGYFAVGGACIH